MGDLSVSLDDVLVTAELARRSIRPPDYAAESRALTALAEAMADSPQTILQKLVEAALDLCHAGSAGISLLESGGTTGVFRWHAVAGLIASRIGSQVLREGSPSGIVLDRNSPLLFSYPERHFDYGISIDPPIVEALLVPLHTDGKPIGTLWAITHTPSRQFDAEDQRVLTSLSHFASLAYDVKMAALIAIRAREDVRQILDGAAIGLARCSRDQRYLACNQAYEKVLGLSAEKIIGRPMIDVMGAKAFEMIRPYIGRVLEGERVEFDVEVPIPEGELRSYHVVDEPLRDSEGEITGWIASVSDITDLKRATELLRDSQERLSLALSSGTIGVWDWDVIRDRSTWSPELYELYGIDAGTADAYEDFSSRVHPGDVAAMESQRDAAIRNHKQFDLEFRIVRPSGEIRWLSARGRGYYDKNGRLVRVVGNNIDITERVLAKEALRERQERQSSQNEAFQAAIAGEPLETSLGTLVRTAVRRFGSEARAGFNVTHDGATLSHLVGMSDAYARDLDGFRIGQASLGCGLATYRREPVISPDVNLDPLWEPWLWLAQKHHYRACWSFPLCTKDGSILGSFALYFGEPRNPTTQDYEFISGLTHAATIIISRANEASERARAEESLREAQERLQRWNVELEQAVHLKTAELIQSEERLRALTMELNLAEQRERQRLAADLHDHLQQMLVLGKLKVGQGGRLSDPASARIMKETENLLSDALTYTHSLVAELSPPVLRYNGLAAGLNWLATYMKKYDIAVAVTVRLPEELKLPDDQVMLIFQSVRELLINSSKYAGTGRADVSLEETNGRMVITVRDDGKGFSLAAAADSSFSSMSSKFGLFSIRERMKALGGSFEIESSPGEGTTATLILPVSKARAAMTDQSELETEPNLRESQKYSVVGTRSSGLQRNVKIRVLLVDDHVMVRQGLRTVLESYSNIEVVGEAGDGREAVEMAERLTPEVIVMDINMPNMNGVHATIEIKSRHPGVKIIALSVNADATYEGVMLQAGAEALLSKEAALDELYRAIRRALSNP